MAITEKVGTPRRSPPAPDDADGRMWTNRLRTRFFGTFPPEKLLPDRQPAYVASWIYVFGVATIAAFIVLVVSGSRAQLRGPGLVPHVVGGALRQQRALLVGAAVHAVMVVHLWGKFWMAAWRGRRAMTWITGVVAFFASIGTAFTGYLVQSNFESQWIAFEAKDGLNAVGVGAWFNVANVGQMLLLHVCLLPLVVGVHRRVARPAGAQARCRAADSASRRRAGRRARDRGGES